MKLPCSIVKELLPNYIDGCCSDEVAEMIQEHLKSCEECQTLYEEMKAPLIKQDPREIEYLRDIKKKNRLKVFIAILLSLGICLFFIITNVYLKGSFTDLYDVSDIHIKGNYVEATIKLQEVDKAIVETTIKKGDSDVYIAQVVKPSIFHQEREKEIKIPLSDIEEYLRIGPFTVSKKGEIFNQTSVELVRNRIPYVGDAPRLRDLIDIVGTRENYGHYFTIQLQTDKEPYCIELHTTRQPLQEYQYSQLERDAQAILASVDNCNQLDFYVNNEMVLHVAYDKKIKDYAQMQKLLYGEE